MENTARLIVENNYDSTIWKISNAPDARLPPAASSKTTPIREHRPQRHLPLDNRTSSPLEFTAAKKRPSPSPRPPGVPGEGSIFRLIIERARDSRSLCAPTLFYIHAQLIYIYTQSCLSLARAQRPFHLKNRFVRFFFFFSSSYIHIYIYYCRRRRLLAALTIAINLFRTRRFVAVCFSFVFFALPVFLATAFRLIVFIRICARARALFSLVDLLPFFTSSIV